MAHDDLSFLTEKIAKRKLGGVTLVIAESPYYYNRIKKAAHEGWGEEVDVYHAEDTKAEVIRQAMESADMFSDGRLIILKHAENIDKPAELAGVVANAQSLSNCLLLIAFDQQKMSSKMKKGKKGDDKGSPLAQISPDNIFHLKRIYANKLPELIRSYAAENGTAIEEDALRRLIAKNEDNTDILFQEIDKLLTFTGGKKSITAADVEKFDGNYGGITAYDIMAELRMKKKEKCLEKLVAFLNNAGSGEALSLIAMIYREMNIIARIRLNAQASDDEAARMVGMHPFIFKQGNYRQASRLLEPKAVRSVLITLADADKRLKSSDDPFLVIYDLVAPLWA